MKKLMYALFVGIVITVLISGHFLKVEKNLSDNLLRLHIIANSNLECDQQIKLKVRDDIIREMGPELSKFSDVKSAKREIESYLPKIRQIAQNTLIKNGYNNQVTVSLENTSFPKKTYNNITLPKGSYDALKVEIGEAKGENWWCVMFPPLCFVDCAGGKMQKEELSELKSSLSDSEYELITSKKQNVQVKFKIYEIWQDGKALCSSLIKSFK